LNDTPISLLERLRLGPNSAAWGRLVELYTPLVRGWLHRYGIQSADADDLLQDVLATLLRELPQFRHDLRRGAFRRWLRNVVINRLRAFWRARKSVLQSPDQADPESVLDRLEDPHSDLSRRWDEEHDRHVVRRLLELLEPEFEPSTWQAFRLFALEGLATQEVAARLNLSINAVRIAKHRVLARFRSEIDGLLD
jgi:RNA polymerase sigma-70 factor (ECF subfamily)